jgi:hypothetical protein
MVDLIVKYRCGEGYIVLALAAMQKLFVGVKLDNRGYRYTNQGMELLRGVILLATPRPRKLTHRNASHPCLTLAHSHCF